MFEFVSQVAGEAEEAPRVQPRVPLVKERPRRKTGGKTTLSVPVPHNDSPTEDFDDSDVDKHYEPPTNETEESDDTNSSADEYKGEDEVHQDVEDCDAEDEDEDWEPDDDERPEVSVPKFF